MSSYMLGAILVSLSAILGIVGSLSIHELGHANAARLLGHKAQIRLRWMGLATEWPGGPPLHRALVSAYGPLASALLSAALFGCSTLDPRWSLLWETAAWTSLYVGVIVQLIPFGPSDGANIVRAIARKDARNTKGASV